MSDGRKLSLAKELQLLAASVEALRLAAKQKLDGSHHAESLPEFAIVMAGGLHVLRDRVRLLQRILIGAVDPARILCDANQADASEEGPGILREWSQEKQVQVLAARYRAAYYRYALERKPAFLRIRHCSRRN